MFLCLFVSSLTLIFSFIFSGLSGIYRRDYSKVSDKPVSQFGSNGAGDGQFMCPSSVTCNSRGEIVVADEKEPFFVCLGQKVKVMDNSLPRMLLLLTSREIMSWLITATIAFRFSTLRASLSGSLGLKEKETVK